ncbi:hypothetical protein H4R18_001877 [Coemansia javaensis]|uniref:Mitochondrial carrier n=1 Tax=Coemansia javaensis TaxID=2761396 RepID=A0A9W8HIC8_9FUNG|nr:hypothetical protein H4R18_001877 [Coemansia javaensis]
MADSSSSAGGQARNPFRPYAEAVGGAGPQGDLQGPLPLEGLRNAGSPLGLSGLPTDVSGLVEDAGGIEYADEALDTAQAATELVKFAGYRYLATLASNPLSLAQTLLQVQCLPAAVRADELQERPDEDDETPDPDDPAYYEYLRARHSGGGGSGSGGVEPYRPGARATVDHRGYVVRSGVGAARPGFQLAALPPGKLAVLQRLAQHPTEGVLSLFKGAFAQWAYDMLHLLLQPTLEGLLNEALGLYDSAPAATYIDASAPSALTLVVSSVAVGWLLSPLELVRTRLAVQSASPIHRKYRGVAHALRTIAREEGGLAALYLSPFHLVPTLVKHALDSVFRNMGSFAIDRVAAIDPYDHPAAFAVAGLLWKTVSAVVMLPIDTVRTRLQAQPRYTARAAYAPATATTTTKSGKGDDADRFREFRTCVPVSPVPYTGMVNCAWRIISEEGESLAAMQRRRQAAPAPGPATEGVARYYGLRGLYPGLTLQLAANVAIFGLGLLGSDEVEVSL